MRILCSAFVVSCMNTVSKTCMWNPYSVVYLHICEFSYSLATNAPTLSQWITVRYTLCVCFHSLNVAQRLCCQYKQVSVTKFSWMWSFSPTFPHNLSSYFAPIKRVGCERLRPRVHWLCGIKSPSLVPFDPWVLTAVWPESAAADKSWHSSPAGQDTISHTVKNAASFVMSGRDWQDQSALEDQVAGDPFPVISSAFNCKALVGWKNVTFPNPHLLTQPTFLFCCILLMYLFILHLYSCSVLLVMP